MLLGGAFSFLLIGGGLEATGYLQGKQDGHRVTSNREGTQPGSSLGTSLVAGGPAEGDVEASADSGRASVSEWSPLFLKGGLSFLVGFCVGYAVRTFLKVSALVAGALLAAYFGLAYFGVLPPIDWQGVEGHFQKLLATVQEQAEGIKAFLVGHLPSAGFASAGLFTGVKGHR